MTAICAKCKRTYQLAEDDSPDRYSCECGSKLYSATDPALQAALEKEAQTKAQRAGIAVECHTCGSRYNLPAEASGRSYRCRCGLTLPIPLQPQLPPQIKRCPDCGGIVSLHAESCPHCGGPQWYKSSPSNSESTPGGPQEVTVTKLNISTYNAISLLLTFGLAALIIGCIPFVLIFLIYLTSK